MAIDPIKVVIEGENRVLDNFKTIEAASKKVFKQIRANATKELAGIGTGLSDSVVKGTGAGEKAAIASAKKIKQSFSSVFEGIQKSLKASLTVSSDQIKAIGKLKAPEFKPQSIEILPPKLPELKFPPVEIPTPVVPPVPLRFEAGPVPEVDIPAVTLPPFNVPPIDIPPVDVEVNVPRVSIPEPDVPPIRFPSVVVPPIPEIDAPSVEPIELSFQAPDIEIPAPVVPPLKFSGVELPDIKVPELKAPPISVPPVEAELMFSRPELPAVPDQEVDVNLMPGPLVIPEPKLPQITLPPVKVPDVEVPAVTIPSAEVDRIDLPALPDITLPAVRVPEIELPQVTLPQLELEVPDLGDLSVDLGQAGDEAEVLRSALSGIIANGQQLVARFQPLLTVADNLRNKASAIGQAVAEIKAPQRIFDATFGKALDQANALKESLAEIKLPKAQLEKVFGPIANQIKAAKSELKDFVFPPGLSAKVFSAVRKEIALINRDLDDLDSPLFKQLEQLNIPVGPAKRQFNQLVETAKKLKTELTTLKAPKALLKGLFQDPIGQIKKVQTELSKLKLPSAAKTPIGQAFSKAVPQIQKVSSALKEAKMKLKEFATPPKRLQTLFSGVLGQIDMVKGKLAKGFKIPSGGGAGGGGVGALVGKLAAAGVAIGVVTAGFGLAAAAGSKFYGPLIASNEQLNQQILGSAANLAATSRIFEDGALVTSATDAISLLQGPLRVALKQIQKDSIDLVGVTSEELTGVFSILNSQAGQLVGQSAKLADPIKAAGKLTIDFSAALGTLGLPLQQAGQEIRSILNGTIDANSALAKQLGITNDQVKLWREQGQLVDQLRDRLQPFIEGNALAAQSIGGVSSNIKDVLEVLGRELGEPLLQPVVDGLNEFYQLIQITEDETQSYYDEIKDFFEPFIAGARQAGELIGSDLLEVVKNLGESAQNWQPIFLAAFQGLAILGKGVTTVLVGVTELLTEITARASGMVDRLSNLPIPGNPFKAFKDDSLEAISIVQGQFDALSNQFQTVQAELDALKAKRAGGAALSEQELAREKALTKQTKGLLVTLKEIKQNSATGLTGFDTESLDKIRNLNNEIDETEALLESLGASDIAVLARDVPDIGSAFRQLNKDAEGALNQVRALSEQGGDASQLQAVAKGLVDATKQQLELGGISREQAAERLNEVISNAKLEKDVKLQAIQELQALQDKASQEAMAAKKLEIEETQADIESGQIKEIEGLSKITKLRQDEINIQLAALREQLKLERQLKDEAIQGDLAALDKQIAEAEAKAENATGADRGSADAEIAGLTRQRETLAATIGLQSEKETELIQKEQELQQNLKEVTEQGARDIGAAQIREIEKSTDKILAATDAAATQRELAAQELLNRELAALNSQNLNPEDRAKKLNEIERRRSDEQLDIQAERIKSEIAAEQERIAQLEALTPADEKQGLENEKLIQAAKRKTGQLALELARNEESQQRAIADRIEKDQQQALASAKKRIQQQLDAQLNAITAQAQALDSQLGSYDRITQQMELQLGLINAQVNSAKEFNSTTQSYFSIASRFARSDRERQKIEEETLQAKLEAQQREFALAQEQLTLEQAQTRALLQQEAIQASIATIKAQAQVAQAQADVAEVKADPNANPQQIRAAELQLQAAEGAVNASMLAEQMIQERIAQQAQLDDIERRKLQDQQGAQLLQTEADLAQATKTKADDREIGRRALETARNRTEISADQGPNRQAIEAFTGLVQRSDALFSEIQQKAAVAPTVVPPTAPTPEAATQLQVEMPTAEEIGQAVAASIANGETKTVTLSPTINNTFQTRPTQAQTRETEQGTLRALKSVLDLAAKG
ncbi:MAG: hypothetical protein AAFZ35_16915 [Cyanobacteria bacterium J06649_12]